MRVLYVGGTGEISLACVEDSVRAGHDVTIYNRGATADPERLGVEHVRGDIGDGDLYSRLADRNFDVVCQFLGFGVDDVERDIRVFAGRCGQYIFISSASIYQKPCSSTCIGEDAPLGNPFWAYSRAKQACEERLLSAHRSRQLAVTVVRPSHTYRRRLPSTVVQGDHLAWRLLNGKPVIAHGDGESVWTLTHANDFARAFVRLFGNDRAHGECVNITDSVGHTWNTILRTVARTLGVDADIRQVLSRTLVGYERAWQGPLLGDKSNTMIFDTRKIGRLADGWRCEISLEQGIALAWSHAAERLRHGYRPDEATDALIDRIIAEQGG